MSLVFLLGSPSGGGILIQWWTGRPGSPFRRLFLFPRGKKPTGPKIIRQRRGGMLLQGGALLFSSSPSPERVSPSVGLAFRWCFGGGEVRTLRGNGGTSSGYPVYPLDTTLGFFEALRALHRGFSAVVPRLATLLRGCPARASPFPAFLVFFNRLRGWTTVPG